MPFQSTTLFIETGCEEGWRRWGEGGGGKVGFLDSDLEFVLNAKLWIYQLS